MIPEDSHAFFSDIRPGRFFGNVTNPYIAMFHCLRMTKRQGSDKHGAPAFEGVENCRIRLLTCKERMDQHIHKNLLLRQFFVIIARYFWYAG